MSELARIYKNMRTKTMLAMHTEVLQDVGYSTFTSGVISLAMTRTVRRPGAFMIALQCCNFN